MSDSVRFVTAWDHGVQAGPGRMHRHEAHELVCHRSGRGTVETESGERTDFNSGSIEIVPADQRHAQHQTLAGRDCCIHFLATPAMGDSLAGLIALPSGLVSAAEFAALLNQPPSRNAVEQRICDCRLTAIVLGVLSAAGRLTRSIPPQGSASEQLARRAYEFVRANWRNIRHVEQIARELNVSADYLRHAFARHYRQSLHNLLTQMRIDYAKDLLRRSYLPQKSLAVICGFSDIQQFSRRFRQVTGMAPGQYRRQPGEPARKKKRSIPAASLERIPSPQPTARAPRPPG